jgi:hypothetical protein
VKQETDARLLSLLLTLTLELAAMQQALDDAASTVLSEIEKEL